MTRSLDAGGGRRFVPYAASRRAPKRNEVAALTCVNPVEAQVSIEGRSPQNMGNDAHQRQHRRDHRGRLLAVAATGRCAVG
jgi:hypothetical protein